MSQQGIEDLIRDTLTDPRRRLDPPPGHYQLVGERIGRARRRRRLRWAGVAAAVVALLAVSALAVQRPRPVPAPYLQPNPAPTSTGQYGGWHTLPNIGSGEPLQVWSDGGVFYLLEENPGTLLMLDDVTFSVMRSVSVPGRPESLAVDRTANGTWVLYTRPDGVTVAREYGELFTPVCCDVPVTSQQVFAAVAVDGQLWLATGAGLYRVSPDDTAPRPVPGVTGFVDAMAFDPVRHRLILTASRATQADPNGGVQVEALDPATMAVTAGAALPLAKESIAVVANYVWVGGFASGDQHLYQLSPVTLKTVGTSEVDKQVGAGAIVSGGYDSLWVQDGAGGALSCVNPVTGAIWQQWSVNLGEVASMQRRLALGVHQPNLVQLTLGDSCPG